MQGWPREVPDLRPVAERLAARASTDNPGSRADLRPTRRAGAERRETILRGARAGASCRLGVLRLGRSFPRELVTRTQPPRPPPRRCHRALAETPPDPAKSYRRRRVVGGRHAHLPFLSE